MNLFSLFVGVNHFTIIDCLVWIEAGDSWTSFLTCKFSVWLCYSVNTVVLEYPIWFHIQTFTLFLLEVFSFTSFKVSLTFSLVSTYKILSMRIAFRLFIDSSEYNRFTFSETWFNNCWAIIKEVQSVDEVWSIESSMSVLIDLFELLKAHAGLVTFVDCLGAVGFADRSFSAK